VIRKYIILIFITFFFNNISFSKTTSDSASTTEEPKGPVKTSDYNLAKKYIRKADKYDNKGKIIKAEKFYKKAIKLLYKSNKEFKVNSNTFNYLGYANKKLGNFEHAEIYYLLGLEIDPKHNSINANLGKLYINLNRIDEAKEKLKVLENCNCDEFIQLSNLIKLGASKY
jgi:tetratricopeptide (TPR) repeat protein